ncbi:MAG: hypothetical protein AB1696_14700 [Planctomycetota bacterium]
MKKTRKSIIRGGLCVWLLLTVGCGVLPVTKRIHGERIRVQRVFQDNFASMDKWVNPNPAAKWRVKNEKLYGNWAPGGSTLWCKRNFESDLYIEFAARLCPPEEEWLKEKQSEGGKNLSLRFLVTGPLGEDILTVYRKLAEEATGPNRNGDDQYRGYFFTWTHTHARLRRSPGYEKVGEDVEFVPEINRFYEVSLLKRGGRIKFWIDGKLIHEYQDDHPFDYGKIGFDLFMSNVEISDLRVYQVLP